LPAFFDTEDFAGRRASEILRRAPLSHRPDLLPCDELAKRQREIFRLCAELLVDLLDTKARVGGDEALHFVLKRLQTLRGTLRTQRTRGYPRGDCPTR
jgi:hypothetical protein